MKVKAANARPNDTRSMRARNAGVVPTKPSMKETRKQMNANTQSMRSILFTSYSGMYFVTDWFSSGSVRRSMLVYVSPA
jgi:hypothetical protein